MFKLYFSSVPSIISTVLIIGFVIFASMVNVRSRSINHWGVLVICIFFLGLLMSFLSGTKDNINTASAVIPPNNWAMIILSILGGLAFIVGIATIFVRRQNFWQIGFYTLSAIIIIKIVITECYRILTYIRG